MNSNNNIIRIEGTVYEIFPLWTNQTVIMKLRGGTMKYEVRVEKINLFLKEPKIGTTIQVLGTLIEDTGAKIDVLALAFTDDLGMSTVDLEMDTVSKTLDYMSNNMMPSPSDDPNVVAKQMLADAGIDLEEEKRRIREEEENDVWPDSDDTPPEKSDEEFVHESTCNMEPLVIELFFNQSLTPEEIDKRVSIGIDTIKNIIEQNRNEQIKTFKSDIFYPYTNSNMPALSYVKFGNTDGICNIWGECTDKDGCIIDNKKDYVFILTHEERMDFECHNNGVVAISHSLDKIKEYLTNNPIKHDPDILDGADYEITYHKVI